MEAPLQCIVEISTKMPVKSYKYQAMKRNPASARLVFEANSFGKALPSRGPSKSYYQRELAQNKACHTDSTKILFLPFFWGENNYLNIFKDTYTSKSYLLCLTMSHFPPINILPHDKPKTGNASQVRLNQLQRVTQFSLQCN